MDSDYGYSSEEQSYAEGSEDEDFDFDDHAEVETAARKVETYLDAIPFCRTFQSVPGTNLAAFTPAPPNHGAVLAWD